MNSDKATDLTAFLKAIDHIRQRRVGQSVAVVGEEDFLLLDEMSDRYETFSDIAPDPGIYECNPPIRRPFTQNFDLFAEVRDDAVAVCRRLVVQEILLDDVCLVSEAKDEILMPVLAVVFDESRKRGRPYKICFRDGERVSCTNDCGQCFSDDGRYASEMATAVCRHGFRFQQHGCNLVR